MCCCCKSHCLTCCNNIIYNQTPLWYNDNISKGSATMPNTQLKNKKMPTKHDIVVATLVVYLVLLVWVIVFKCNNIKSLHIEFNRSMTILERLKFKAIPFKYTIERILEGRPLEILATIFNVVCFVPMTMLFRLLKLSGKQSLLLAGGISLAIEIFQLFSCWGGFDVSDWILNMLGAWLGVALFKPFAKLTDKTQCVILGVCSLIVLPVDIFAIINTALHFPPIG